MKVFLDANILISVLNKEYPSFTYTSRLVSLTDTDRFRFYTSSTCLAIAFYFACKKTGIVSAKKKIGLLAEKIYLTENRQEDIQAIIGNKKILDFEDGLEYYAALRAGCDCIVTEDQNDFYFSDIEVSGSLRLLEKYVL